MNTINPQVYSKPSGATSIAGITENAQGSNYGVQLPGAAEGLEAATQYNGIPETGSLDSLPEYRQPQSLVHLPILCFLILPEN